MRELSHHPVCAEKVASRLFSDRAATPPRRGGEIGLPEYVSVITKCSTKFPAPLRGGEIPTDVQTPEPRRGGTIIVSPLRAWSRREPLIHGLKPVAIVVSPLRGGRPQPGFPRVSGPRQAKDSSTQFKTPQRDYRLRQHAPTTRSM
jgi:hypothetical protein